MDTVTPNASAVANSGISCSNLSASISGNSSTSGATYSWAGPGGFTSSGQNPSATAAGIYTVTVTDPANGCTNTATVTVTSNVALPNVNPGANDTLPCGAGATVNLNGSSSTSGATFSWSGPGGFTSTSQNPAVTATGTYTLVVTDPSNGCSDSAFVSIATDMVTAGFTANPTVGVVPLTVNFTNTSTGATGYTWSFGDGGSSTGVNPSNIYGTSGTYTVVLIASNANCTDTATATIVVNDNFSVIIPNVFTPNGDGSNDVFFITSTGVTELTGDIFNRWGEKIYSLVGVNSGWDGKNLSGVQASSGTYYVVLKLKGVDGKVYERQAYVGLFR
jgi:gliding motility-associated-like protein